MYFFHCNWCVFSTLIHFLGGFFFSLCSAWQQSIFNKFMVSDEFFFVFCFVLFLFCKLYQCKIYRYKRESYLNHSLRLNLKTFLGLTNPSPVKTWKLTSRSIRSCFRFCFVCSHCVSAKNVYNRFCGMTSRDLFKHEMRTYL